MRKDEYILCAAIHFDDGVERDIKELDGKTGFVVTGFRHSNAWYSANQFAKHSHLVSLHKEDGFLTNRNRFVGRIEAGQIAFIAKQIQHPVMHPLGLFSEDLY